MRDIEKVCPYCNSKLVGHNVKINDYGNIVNAKNNFLWCSAEDCLGIPGINRTFTVDEEGFLIDNNVDTYYDNFDNYYDDFETDDESDEYDEYDEYDDEYDEYDD